MHGRAYSLFPTQETSSRVCGVFRSLKQRVRARFSRSPKPMDHLGGMNPEDSCLISDRKPENDLEYWPKLGSSIEEMEIRIG